MPRPLLGELLFSSPMIHCPICSVTIENDEDAMEAAKEHFTTAHDAMPAFVPSSSDKSLKLVLSIPHVNSRRIVPVMLFKDPNILVLAVCIISSGPIVDIFCYQVIGNAGMITLSSVSRKVTWSGAALSNSVKLETALDTLGASFHIEYVEDKLEFVDQEDKKKCSLETRIYFGFTMISPDSSALLRQCRKKHAAMSDHHDDSDGSCYSSESDEEKATARSRIMRLSL